MREYLLSPGWLVSRIICRVRLSHTVIYSHRTNQFQFLWSFSRFFQHFKRLFSSVPPKWWQQSLVIFPLNLSLYESVGITKASPFHKFSSHSISFIDVSLWSGRIFFFSRDFFFLFTCKHIHGNWNEVDLELTRFQLPVPNGWEL